MAVTINGTTGFTFPNGTEGTPSLTGLDSDTGLFFGTNEVSITTGGTRKLFVDSTGRVGINTTTFVETRDSLIVAPVSGQTDTFLTIKTTNTNGQTRLHFADPDDNNPGDITYQHSINAFQIKTADEERVRIDSNGNVGIGSTIPTTKLDVDGDVNISGYLGVDGILYKKQTPIYFDANNLGEVQIVGSGNNLKFYNPVFGSGGDWIFDTYSYGEVVRITNSGNVGIGTTNPADGAKLHIQDGGGLLVRRSSGTSVARFGNTSSVTPNITVFGSTTVNEPYLGCDGDNLTFGTGNQERLRIDSNGNVGIGTPGSYAIWGSNYRKLELSSSSASIIQLNSTSANSDTKFIGGIDFANYASGVTTAESAFIGCYQNGTSATAPGGALRFFTRQDGGSLTERISILQDGKVGIGVTNPTYGVHLAYASYLPHLFHASEYSVRAASVGSTGANTFSFTFSTGYNTTYLVTAASAHYGLSSYSCMRQSYYHAGPNGTETNLHNYTTAPHGSWSFSWSNNVLTVTHNAGSYAGGSSFWVVVQGG